MVIKSNTLTTKVRGCKLCLGTFLSWVWTTYCSSLWSRRPAAAASPGYDTPPGEWSAELNTRIVRKTALQFYARICPPHSCLRTGFVSTLPCLQCCRFFIRLVASISSARVQSRPKYFVTEILDTLVVPGGLVLSCSRWSILDYFIGANNLINLSVET